MCIRDSSNTECGLPIADRMSFWHNRAVMNDESFLQKLFAAGNSYWLTRFVIQTLLGSQTAGMLRVPTLFWFGISDRALSIFAWIGFGLSLVVLGGYANAILLTVLWAMYMSIVHIGQIWYGYGWEIQLLET